MLPNARRQCLELGRLCANLPIPCVPDPALAEQTEQCSLGSGLWYPSPSPNTQRTPSIHLLFYTVTDTIRYIRSKFQTVCIQDFIASLESLCCTEHSSFWIVSISQLSKELWPFQISKNGILSLLFYHEQKVWSLPLKIAMKVMNSDSKNATTL